MFFDILVAFGRKHATNAQNKARATVHSIITSNINQNCVHTRNRCQRARPEQIQEISSSGGPRTRTEVYRSWGPGGGPPPPKVRHVSTIPPVLVHRIRPEVYRSWALARRAPSHSGPRFRSLTEYGKFPAGWLVSLNIRADVVTFGHICQKRRRRASYCSNLVGSVQMGTKLAKTCMNR